MVQFLLRPSEIWPVSTPGTFHPFSGFFLFSFYFLLFSLSSPGSSALFYSKTDIKIFRSEKEIIANCKKETSRAILFPEPQLFVQLRSEDNMGWLWKTLQSPACLLLNAQENRFLAFWLRSSEYTGKSVICRHLACSKKVSGTSLAAQWLRICLPVQGTQVQFFVWEDPTCRRATKPVNHNCGAPAP